MCFNCIMETCNISFSGMLYGRLGNRKTKGIVCCAHGDRKFIKFVNKLAEEKPDTLKISAKEDSNPKLIIETKEIPYISPIERLAIRLDKMQRKALKLRAENKITALIYEFRQNEYLNMRRRYPFISQKTLDKFEENIQKLAPENLKSFFTKFFS